MSSRQIVHLHYLLQPIAQQFKVDCEREFGRTNIDIIITSTYRSPEEQDALYAQGRTKPGPIVTKAKGGQSKHNFRQADGTPASLAFDIVPLRNGIPVWGSKGNGIDLDPTDDDTDDLELWQKVGAIGVNLGLVWYGSPGAEFKEFPHFQHPRANEIMKGGA